MTDLPSPPLSRAICAKLAASIISGRSAELRWIKVAMIGSRTLDFLKSYLIVEGARRGLGLDVWTGPYGQIEQQALDPASGLYAAKPDIVWILPDVEELAPGLTWNYQALAAKPGAVDPEKSNLLQRMQQVLTSIRQQSPMKILIGNFIPPSWGPTGLLDGMMERSFASTLQDLNDDLAAQCRAIADARVINMSSLLAQVGMKQWVDERMAWIARAPMSSTAMNATAELAARHFSSWYVPPKKCLVLDMDNTLWGGVLGEAGSTGIQLGADYPGSVFVDFQRRILALRERGVLLAAASKNNLEDVEKVFVENAAMILKREHFSAFEVHWEDKATSLRRIASTLNIGLDSLVFFDDNAVEREWVRTQLPDVSVIEAPASPMEYGRSLEASELFDTFSLTHEDSKRAELYQQDSVRTDLMAKSSSLDDFIRSLEMKMTVGHFDEASLPRIVQLLGKTNQFNLTTQRHGTAEIQQMLNAGGIGLWARVQDRFGDTGLVAVAIAAKNGDSWMIDSFLMSCRVIGRSVETALLAVLERLVHRAGGRELTGCYLPTDKNQPAADFYPRHGYTPASQDGSLWHLRLDELRPLPDSFEITGIEINP
jgi:FkbH-like protein